MKSVIVTGASSGIGRAATIRLAKSGHRVFGLARSYDKLQALVAELSADSYIPIEFDITKPETFDSALGAISKDGIFALVNNAGFVEPGAIEDLSMESIREQFEVNFFGLVGLTKKVLPMMMQNNEGRIVNVSSIAGLISLPLIGAYCATKHALEAVTDALRMELWNTNVRVVSINPGVIETNIHAVTKSKTAPLAGSRFAGAYKKYLEDVPRGLPASIVADAIFEAVSSPSPKARYLLGSAKEKAGARLRPYIPDGLFYSEVAKRILS